MYFGAKNRMMRSWIIIILLFSALGINAQFSDVLDTIACFEYQIEPAMGANLSADIKYSTEPMGQGMQFDPNSIITQSTQLFLYDCINGWEECYFVAIINNAPIIEAPDTILACDYYVLPTIEGSHITANGAYYTEPFGQGERFFPGHLVDETDTFYIYDGVGSCYDMHEIIIDMAPSPVLYHVRDIINCFPVALPYFNGVRLPALTYYYNESTGEKLYPNDIVSMTSTLIIVADTSGCVVRDTLKLIIDDPIDFQLQDVTVCDSYRLDLSQYADSGHRIYSGSGDHPIQLSSLEINGSTEVCLIDSMYTDQCTREYCFNVVVHELPKIDKLFRDTINVCNVSEVSLYSIIRHFVSGRNYHIIDLYDVPGNSNQQDLSGLDGYYNIMIATAPNINCPEYEPESLLLTIHVDPNCIKEDKLVLNEDHCTTKVVSLPYILNNMGLGLGGELFDSEFEDVPFPYELENIGDDTLYYYYVSDLSATEQDTLSICFLPEDRPDFVPLFYQGDTNLCYQDCFRFSYDPEEDFDPEANLNWVLFHVELWLDEEDPILLRNNLFYIDRMEICFNEDSISHQFINVEVPEKDYYLVVPRQASGFFGWEYCYKDLASDTIRFSTKHNTYREYTSKICPSEQVEIQGEIFDYGRPNGQVVIPNADTTACDSIINVELEFYDSSINYISRTFCDTAKYLVVNCIRYDIDNPRDTVFLPATSSVGCDSTIIVDIYYQVPNVLDTLILMCENDSIVFDNEYYQSGDVLIDTLYSAESCDSLYRFIEFSYQPSIEVIDTITCPNVNITLHGQQYASGIYMDTIHNQIGCDSIVLSLDIKEYTSYLPLINDTVICANDTLYFELNELLENISLNNNQVLGELKLFAEGSYQLKAITPDGCEELRDFSISFAQVDVQQVDLQICDGDTIEYNDHQYYEAGIYFDTLRIADNCDTLITEIRLSHYLNEWQFDETYFICTDDSLLIDTPVEIEELYYVDIPLPTEPFVIRESGNYVVHYKDPNNCSCQDSFSVSIADNPEILTQDLVDTVFHNDLLLPIIYQTEISSYSWYPSTGLSCDDCPYPTLLSDQNNAYTITVSTEHGCTRSAEIYVSFKSNEIYLPNIISPNANHEANRMFRLTSSRHIIYDLYIYDRWGNQVVYMPKLDSSDQTQGWAPSDQLMQGVYVYQIILEDGTQMAGSLTVVK